MIVRIGFEPRLPPAEERDPEEDVREQRDHADEHGDERHQADVAVADVGDLVREHAFELPLVHQLDDARRHGDVGGLGVASGRERVRCRVLDQPQLGRLLEPRGDGDVLEQPVELGVVALLDPLGARPRADHRAGGEPGEDRVEESRDRDDDEQARLEDVRERDAEHADEEREEKEQPSRPPPVGADLLLDGHDWANETSTGWSTPSPASKNSRGWKRERASDEQRRERLLAVVEAQHGRVVVAAGGGDLVLGVRQLVLEREEVLAMREAPGRPRRRRTACRVRCRAPRSPVLPREGPTPA